MEATSDRDGRSVDISFAGARDEGSRTAGGGDLRLLPPEHGCTLNHDQYHYGPVSGGGAETGAKDIQSVLGTGRVDVEGMRTVARRQNRRRGGEDTDGTDTETD